MYVIKSCLSIILCFRVRCNNTLKSVRFFKTRSTMSYIVTRAEWIVFGRTAHDGKQYSCPLPRPFFLELLMLLPSIDMSKHTSICTTNKTRTFVFIHSWTYRVFFRQSNLLFRHWNGFAFFLREITPGHVTKVIGIRCAFIRILFQWISDSFDWINNCRRRMSQCVRQFQRAFIARETENTNTDNCYPQRCRVHYRLYFRIVNSIECFAKNTNL